MQTGAASASSAGAVARPAELSSSGASGSRHGMAAASASGAGSRFVGPSSEGSAANCSTRGLKRKSTATDSNSCANSPVAAANATVAGAAPPSLGAAAEQQRGADQKAYRETAASTQVVMPCLKKRAGGSHPAMSGVVALGAVVPESPLQGSLPQKRAKSCSEDGMVSQPEHAVASVAALASAAEGIRPDLRRSARVLARSSAGKQ